jgi:hypothetical protein
LAVMRSYPTLKLFVVIAAILIVSCGGDGECPQKVSSRGPVSVMIPYETLSLDRLISDADLIVIGTAGLTEPLNVRWALSETRTSCRWKIAFNVREPELLKGALDIELTVLLHASAHASSQPQVSTMDIGEVQSGEHLLLFLKKFDGDIGYEPVAGQQGVWRIKDGVAAQDHPPPLMQPTTPEELAERIAASP